MLSEFLDDLKYLVMFLSHEDVFPRLKLFFIHPNEYALAGFSNSTLCLCQN